jgi:putative ABC transport system substrate-binding protein
VTARRAFIGTLAAGLLAAPLAASAEQAGKMPRVAILFVGSRSDPAVQRAIDAFKQGLRELGHEDGQIAMEDRWAEGHQECLRGLAAKLVRLKPDVIVALAASTTEAAAHATKAIPIVTVANDPVAGGFATSIARPTGNTTGLSMMAPELAAKQLGLFREIVPTISRVAVLGNPANPGNALLLRQAEAAARALGVRLQPLEARDSREVDRAFAAMTRDRADALLVLVDPVLGGQRERIAHLAATGRLPAVYGVRTHAEAGGLMVYGANLFDLYRRAATYVDKILRGAKPAELPVEQPTKFELVINLKTAKALGLTIPPTLLGRADEVIQ